MSPRKKESGNGLFERVFSFAKKKKSTTFENMDPRSPHASRRKVVRGKDTSGAKAIALEKEAVRLKDEVVETTPEVVQDLERTVNYERRAREHRGSIFRQGGKRSEAQFFHDNIVNSTAVGIQNSGIPSHQRHGASQQMIGYANGMLMFYPDSPRKQPSPKKHRRGISSMASISHCQTGSATVEIHSPLGKDRSSDDSIEETFKLTSPTEEKKGKSDDTPGPVNHVRGLSGGSGASRVSSELNDRVISTIVESGESGCTNSLKDRESVHMSAGSKSSKTSSRITILKEKRSDKEKKKMGGMALDFSKDSSESPPAKIGAITITSPPRLPSVFVNSHGNVMSPRLQKLQRTFDEEKKVATQFLQLHEIAPGSACSTASNRSKSKTVPEIPSPVLAHQKLAAPTSAYISDGANSSADGSEVPSLQSDGHKTGENATPERESITTASSEEAPTTPPMSAPRPMQRNGKYNSSLLSKKRNSWAGSLAFNKTVRSFFSFSLFVNCAQMFYRFRQRTSRRR